MTLNKWYTLTHATCCKQDPPVNHPSRPQKTPLSHAKVDLDLVSQECTGHFAKSGHDSVD